MIYWRVNNKKLHSFEACTNILFVIATNLNINWMYSIIQRRGRICYWRNSFAASHWPNVVDGVQRDMWLQSQKLHQNPIRDAQVAWNQFSKVILILPDAILPLQCDLFYIKQEESPVLFLARNNVTVQMNTYDTEMFFFCAVRAKILIRDYLSFCFVTC